VEQIEPGLAGLSRAGICPHIRLVQERLPLQFDNRSFAQKHLNISGHFFNNLIIAHFSDLITSVGILKKMTAVIFLVNFYWQTFFHHPYVPKDFASMHPRK